MVDVQTRKMKFSSKGPFVLWDWRDSEKKYMDDTAVDIYFFIKDKNPKEVLDKLFLNQMICFGFRRDFEEEFPRISGGCLDSFRYLFAPYSASRMPSFDWTFYNHPIKRDTNPAKI